MKFKEFVKEIEALEKAGEVHPDKRIEFMDAALVFQDEIQNLIERMNELPDAELSLDEGE